jgi:DNA-binding MarR family transcriptional regulator
MATNEDARAVAQAKRKNTAHSLLRAARLLNELAVARVRRRPNGESRLRPSHTAVLPHLDLDGTRLTVLAERLGVSKQATSELVTDLESFGMVERRPDPSDGRAKRVCFTALGRKALLDGLALLQSIEDELRQELGARDMAALARVLPKVEEVLARRLQEQDL